MATSIRPLHDRVLIQRIEEDHQARGGIIIPDTAKEKPQQGKVIARGDGKINEDGTRRPVDVKPGDQVLFGKYSGSEVKIDDQEYLIMREDEIRFAQKSDFSVQPLCSLCLCGCFPKQSLTTETQRTLRLHREEHGSGLFVQRRH